MAVPLDRGRDDAAATPALKPGRVSRTDGRVRVRLSTASSQSSDTEARRSGAAPDCSTPRSVSRPRVEARGAARCALEAGRKLGSLLDEYAAFCSRGLLAAGDKAQVAEASKPRVDLPVLLDASPVDVAAPLERLMIPCSTSEGDSGWLVALRDEESEEEGVVLEFMPMLVLPEARIPSRSAPRVPSR